MEPMSYIGLDVHKRKVSYCAKDSSGKIHSEGTISATRLDPNYWMETLPHRLWYLVQSSRILVHGHQCSLTAKMSCRRLSLPTGNRITWRFIAITSLYALWALASLAAAKDPSTGSFQEKKGPSLQWDPPDVDVPIPTLNGAPACSLPDVLKQAGQQSEELIRQLQDFLAHEQFRYAQTGRLDMSGSTGSVGRDQVPYEQKDKLGALEMYVTADFEYQVDFGQQAGVLNVHETRVPRSGTNEKHVASILNKGLATLALIFYPTLRGDYEMHCEGSTLWNDHFAWVIQFRQMRGKHPRTVQLETVRGTYPLGIKGRAWIAADSGQVMHLESNLVEPNLAIDLQSNTLSVDYAPVKFQSQTAEIWLPQTAFAWTDFDKRRMVSEHTFSNFRLFTVQTREIVNNPPSPPVVEKTSEGSAPQEPYGAKSSNANEDSKAGAGTSESVTTAADPIPAWRNRDWLPADVDVNVPPVEVGTACNLEEVLPRVGARIQEMVANLEYFTATESLLQETITNSGKVSGREMRKYDYLVSFREIRPGILDVHEDLNGRSSSIAYLSGFATKGLPALMLIFHPYYSDTFSMRCEGVASLNGQRSWQIYFRQRADKPNRIRDYTIGEHGSSRPVALKGRAWFIADTYQIASLQTDLIDKVPEIQLTVDHAAIEYGPVHSKRLGVDIWLPHAAELYTEFRGRRIHQQMSYTNYLLFTVDDTQRISSPKSSN